MLRGVVKIPLHSFLGMCGVLVLAAAGLSALPAAPVSYSEAPMLRKQVEQGLLPPVQERLPEQPLVVEPYESLGRYGGYDNPMRTITSATDACNEIQYMVYEPLLRFAGDGQTIVPNLVTHYELAADSRSVTLYLRRGLRWSDGVPVTVDDVLFAWHDVFLNKDLNTRPPSAFRVNGEPMVIEPIDRYTFRLVFAQPYGSIPYFLTRTMSYTSLVMPKHFLKNYHANYRAKDELEELAREQGFEHWFELFRDINHTQQAINPRMPPDYPTLGPWHVVDVPATGNTIMERNPYYWKVDPSGRQLPYIDRVHETYVGTPEARNLMFVTGKIDFGGIHCRLENSPLFLSNREKGGYKVYFWRENQGTRVAYYFNQTHPDPERRRLFQDRRFRIALSHAINRQEMNEILYFGKGIPRQDTVNRACSFLEPEFETAYAEYDRDKANRILDELGLQRGGAAGWRTLPNGRTLAINLDAIPVEPYLKSAELIKEYWQAVGVLLNYRVVSSSLIWVRVSGNLHDVVGYPNDVATDIMVLNAALLGIGNWAPLWARWFAAKGEAGEKPPARIRDLYKLWEELRRVGTVAERTRLGKRLVRSQAENLWGIGTVGHTLRPIVVSNRLRNVARYMKDADGILHRDRMALWGWPWLCTFLHHPEQFYLEE